MQRGVTERHVIHAKRHQIVMKPRAEWRSISVKADTPEATGSVVETIVNQAIKENADLIIVGTRGLGGFKRLLLGSVSNGVVSNAHCPVLIIR